MPAPVLFEFPASAQNAALARTVAAAMAARADLSVDLLEDARLAVTEALATMEALCGPDSAVKLTFDARPQRLDVTVVGASQSLPDLDSLSWTILSALATDLGATLMSSSVHLTFAIADLPRA